MLTSKIRESSSSSFCYLSFTAKLVIILVIWSSSKDAFIPMCLSAGSSRKVSSTISCYTCNSRNETDINCHDPFNPAMSKYVENCKVPKQNHIGVFPARFCVKVTGKTVETGESLVIRACSLESMDNQCGKFKFEGFLYVGCILTCDYDGCNHSFHIFDHLNHSVAFLFISLAILILLSSTRIF